MVIYVSNRKKHPSHQSSEGKSIKQSDGPAVTDLVPPSALESIVSSNSSRHLAMTHDDTSEGAVHCFQDEYGEYDYWPPVYLASGNTGYWFELS